MISLLTPKSFRYPLAGKDTFNFILQPQGYPSKALTIDLQGINGPNISSRGVFPDGVASPGPQAMRIGGIGAGTLWRGYHTSTVVSVLQQNFSNLVDGKKCFGPPTVVSRKNLSHLVGRSTRQMFPTVVLPLMRLATLLANKTLLN